MMVCKPALDSFHFVRTQIIFPCPALGIACCPCFCNVMPRELVPEGGQRAKLAFGDVLKSSTAAATSNHATSQGTRPLWRADAQDWAQIC